MEGGGGGGFAGVKMDSTYFCVPVDGPILPPVYLPGDDSAEGVPRHQEPFAGQQDRHLRLKPPIISVRSDFSSVSDFHFNSNRKSVPTGRTEIMRLHFHFLQNANLDTHNMILAHNCQIFSSVYANLYTLEKIWTGMCV